MTALVDLHIDQDLATITLARIGKRNALNTEFANAIANALGQAEKDGARIVVLRSATSVFSAGVDLSEPMKLGTDSPELIVAHALLATPLFVISVVEGPNLAGGLIIASVSPLVIATTAARFWLPERSIGIFPGRVLAFLEQVVPARQAFWYGVSERHITAERAAELGLVSTIVEPEALGTTLAELTSELAAANLGFLDAARLAWVRRFDTRDHLDRRNALDELLIANVTANDQSAPIKD